MNQTHESIMVRRVSSCKAMSCIKTVNPVTENTMTMPAPMASGLWRSQNLGCVSIGQHLLVVGALIVSASASRSSNISQSLIVPHRDGSNYDYVLICETVV